MNESNNISYQQKNKWLLWGTVLVVVLIGWFSIRPTVLAYFKNQQYQEEIRLAQTAPQEINKYKETLSSMKSYGSPAANKDRLFEVVSNFAAKKKLTIKALGAPEIAVQENYSIATHKIEVEGDFKSITQLIYELEQKERVGNVVSTHYHAQQDRRKKRKRLTATIFVQHVHPITIKNS